MPKRFIVRTDFKANDNLSPAMKKMSRGFGKFASGLADKNSMIGRSFGNVNRVINRGLAVGMLALAASTGIAAAEYVKLDQVIVGANARFKDTVLGSKQQRILKYYQQQPGKSGKQPNSQQSKQLKALISTQKQVLQPPKLWEYSPTR